MMILKLLCLLLLALLVLAEAEARTINRPRPPVISRPLPSLPTLPGRPIKRFAENWQEFLCTAVAWSVSPTLPAATQKLYLGDCPPRQVVAQWPIR